MVIRNISIGLLLNIIFAVDLYSQKSDSVAVRLMFYNTENLFDTSDDSLTDDNEFLPAGLRRWNSGRYNSKISALYKTIVAAGGWQPPAIVALCEVENRSVLEDLVYGTFLMKFDYGIIHEESPDPRGIDVCMIYNRRIVSLIDHYYLIPRMTGGNAFTSRSILYARLLFNCDTLHLFVNHWPSRRGGVLAGEGMRMKLASLVRDKVDSLTKSSHGRANIIITGDFNCTPDDQEISSLKFSEDGYDLLVNISEKPAERGEGTYRYMGIWEMIDQVLVSKHLLTGTVGLYAEESGLRVFNPDFLLRRDARYPGLSPFSTYHGYKYQGGFSDHLPLVLDLGFR